MGVERCYGEEEIMSNCQMLCKLHKKGKRGERKEKKKKKKEKYREEKGEIISFFVREMKNIYI